MIKYAAANPHKSNFLGTLPLSVLGAHVTKLVRNLAK